MAIKLF